MERAAELLRLEQLAEELQARSDEMQAQLLRTPRIVGPRRMLRAFPGLKHGVKKTTLKALRLGLARRESPKKNRRKTAPTPARMPETAAQKTAAQECSGLFMPRLPDPSGVPFFFAAMSQCFKYLFSKV